VDVGSSTRRIELVKGEAYFRVKHDPSSPFVVTVGRHRIIDLGTKFLIRTNSQLTKVVLVEGRAQLESTNDTRGAIILIPGDVAIASNDHTQVTRKTSQALQDDLAWQRGLIVFRNERLADAVNELNRYGGPPLRVADEGAGKLRINGTFLTGRPEEFAGAAHEIFGIRVRQQNGIFVLSR
jgi:transmembrane sensor